MTYFTITNKEIPQENITKEYKKGTCDYKVKVDCPRCFGTGQVGSYGVCFRCGGACKEITSKKGYTPTQLQIELDNQDQNKLTVASNKAANQGRDQLHAKKLKNALQVQILITCGGNSSDFASSLASQMYLVLSGQNKGRMLSEKQMIFVDKYIYQGCNYKDQPYEKIIAYVNSIIS